MRLALSTFVMLALGLGAVTSHATIFRWYGQVIPGTDAIWPEPGLQLDYRDLFAASLENRTLTGANFAGSTLSSAHLFGSKLTNADLSGADLRSARLDGSTLTNADLSGADLTSTDLDRSTLIGADLSGAVARGASFVETTSRGFTQAQLQSTASYITKDLRGLALGYNDLSGWDFHQQDLTGAGLDHSNLTGANLSGAKLTSADLSRSTLTDADLRGADLRGARWEASGGGVLGSTILPNGNLLTLILGGHERLTVRDDDGVRDPAPAAWLTPRAPIPITIQTEMAVAAGGTLELAFSANDWGSTIKFRPGIQVELGGVLDLTFDSQADAAAQVGHSLRAFDWSGVSPTGAFTISSLYDWDTSDLLSTGTVTLLAAGGVIAGDADGNGKVDMMDFSILKTHFGAEGDRGKGDANGDGRVDLSDFGLFKVNFGKSDPHTTPVPEPATIALAMLAIGLLAGGTAAIPTTVRQSQHRSVRDGVDRARNAWSLATWPAQTTASQQVKWEPPNHSRERSV